MKRIMKKMLSLSTLTLGLTAALSSCASLLTPEQRVQLAATTSGVTDLNVAPHAGGGLDVTGKLSGNPFAARFPANWNGNSVLSAHGYVLPSQQETVPMPAVDPSIGLLSTAYAEGYATANTAYAKTGYAVKEGVEANKRLRDFLNAAGSKLIYITGISMGGDITVALAEKYPNDFAGALPYCGVVAGWRNEERWLFDFRVVYDYFTKPLGAPYALPGAGDAFTPRADYTLSSVTNSVGALFTAAGKGDMKAAAIIGQISKVTGVAADPVSFITPLASGAYGLQDYLTTTGGIGLSNQQTVYTGSADDAALNAGVQRFTTTPAASAFLDANYSPSGKFSIKMLSVHNLVDPLVPYRQEPEFAAVVAAAGNSANLVQQVVNAKPVNLTDIQNSGPAHCYFTPGQIGFAWNELRSWVEGGVRPEAGLNITNK